MKTSDTRPRAGECRGERAGAGARSPVRPSTPPRVPRQRALALILTLVAFLPGCGYYSFTGATIAENLDTIAVPLAEDNSLSPLPTLGETFTDLLVDRFVQQTRLSLEPAEGDADAVLDARISRYENRPTSVGGDEFATLNRITITAVVRYYDRVRDEELLEQSFSSFADYDPTDEEEEEVAQSVLATIADDVFTAATSDW